MPNKKGMTLMEMMVVVIVIAALVAMAYPTYMSALEKARAQEAIQLISHIAAAQDKYRGECYNMSSGTCLYSSDFTKLPLEISGANKAQNISVTANKITTSAYEYTIPTGTTNILATPRSKSYEYTITADMTGTTILCNTGGKSSGKKICSSIGIKTSTDNVYVIE